mmetsp:Transcript_1661/g.2939  ORF Transcript_1661/g.2939 Transcript_1661/m.2939 type:complete len:88 (-) Transcript_1661:99-362(-)
MVNEMTERQLRHMSEQGSSKFMRNLSRSSEDSQPQRGNYVEYDFEKVRKYNSLNQFPNNLVSNSHYFYNRGTFEVYEEIEAEPSSQN